MKRVILFFAVCLGLSVTQTTFADNAETARAATKRTGATNISVSGNTNRASSLDSARGESVAPQNARGTKNQQKVSNRNAAQRQNVKPRNAANKNASSDTNVIQRLSNIQKNTPYAGRADARKSVQNATTPITRSAIKAKKSATRVAEINTEKVENIKSANYSKCKTIYFECMDEFCANKDANLRRCACSSRIHEFDGIKKQLNQAEDKMLDFNQRLLTVSLDKEDAAAINVATEGELAFNKKDSSESEKLLKKITDALNNSGNSKLNNSLASISLSLDMDTAWDNIDSLSGIATTSKSGTDLYNAAGPVCVAMAREVCSDEELSIAQSSYQLTIQQDCNTVAKYYDTLYNQAMDKIHESSALLDMSRLDNYQKRNSDDTLTCKKKILAQLSDASVCGTNLYKCLDMTGEYIDPSTGEAFLSDNLYNLMNLLQEPVADERWSQIDKNEAFVNFLNSKKKFLEPAIAQCDDIADTIWKEFLDDALSQIKIAQNSKLEEIRQSCTTLVSECKTKTMDDLAEFDARALSTFNVLADATVNEMCSDIENACISLMNNSSAAEYWTQGVIGISSDITYNAIIDTCTQVGRDCIIQKCNGTGGNFALCQDITSDNRIDILSRAACWNEVLACVRQADNLENISINREDYYNANYSEIASGAVAFNNIPSYCTGEDENDVSCLITEQIWGTCNSSPSENFVSTDSPNQILVPNNDSTLLSWFAANTGTTENAASCSIYGCNAGYKKDRTGNCQIIYQRLTNDCNMVNDVDDIIGIVPNNLTNYCETGIQDKFHNCCAAGTNLSNDICVPEHYNAFFKRTLNCPINNGPERQYCLSADWTNRREIYLYCITPNEIPSSACNGTDETLLLVDEYGNYATPGSSPRITVSMGYKMCSGCSVSSGSYSCGTNGVNCISTYTPLSGWSFSGRLGVRCTQIQTTLPTDNEFMINYTD